MIPIHFWLIPISPENIRMCLSQEFLILISGTRESRVLTSNYVNTKTRGKITKSSGNENREEEDWEEKMEEEMEENMEVKKEEEEEKKQRTHSR